MDNHENFNLLFVTNIFLMSTTWVCDHFLNTTQSANIEILFYENLSQATVSTKVEICSNIHIVFVNYYLSSTHITARKIGIVSSNIISLCVVKLYYNINNLNKIFKSVKCRYSHLAKSYYHLSKQNSILQDVGTRSPHRLRTLQ